MHFLQVQGIIVYNLPRIVSENWTLVRLIKQNLAAGSIEVTAQHYYHHHHRFNVFFGCMSAD